MVRLDPLYVHVTEALVIRKFGSAEVAFANLTLHDNFWAISLDMLEQLGPSHVLEVFMVADVAAEFGTFVHRMFL